MTSEEYETSSILYFNDTLDLWIMMMVDDSYNEEMRTHQQAFKLKIDLQSIQFEGFLLKVMPILMDWYILCQSSIVCQSSDDYYHMDWKEATGKENWNFHWNLSLTYHSAV